MEYVVALVILSLLFLAAVTTSAIYLFKLLQKALATQVEIEKQRTATTKHLANLLASKDPLAFQQVQTVSVQADTGYTGPYLPGDDLEALEEEVKTIDKLWQRFGNDTDLSDGN